MDKKFVCTVLAVLFVTTGSAVLVSRTEPPNTAPLHEKVEGVEQEPPSQSSSGAPSEQSSAPDYAYVIREYEGRVAVFSAGNDQKPEMVLDLLVKYLPDYDRSQMQQGIPVRDYAELISRIEDYIS